MKSLTTVLRVFLHVIIFFFPIQLGAQQNVSAELDPLVSHIDSSVHQGDDFFLYANGKWFKENPIPPSESTNGIFILVYDTIDSQIKNICEASAKKTGEPKGSNKQKIGDFYYAGMDSINLNKNGWKDLQNTFVIIDEIKSTKDIPKVAAYIHRIAGPPMFYFGLGPDDKNSLENAIFIYQSGLSLPDQSYYFDDEERAVQIREKFAEHLNRVFKMMGYTSTEAIKATEGLIELETAIANASRKREDLRNPTLNYNKLSFKQLLDLTPNFDWEIFFDDVGLNNVDSVVIGQPDYFTSLNDYLRNYTIGEWKNYLKYRLLHYLSEYLDDKTFQEFFDFYETTLYGVTEPRPRWKRVVIETNNSLGELIGQVYVNEYLPKNTKKKLLEIGNSIKEVFAERIKNLDWMSEQTKTKALKKLNSLRMNVGYPDKWKDLSSLEIDRTSYVRNIMNANKWMFNYNIHKYGKPVDRGEWVMYPQTYNAYYWAEMNTILIPGSIILNPGYEGKLADDAILYSTVGFIFGHEMTHGFDNKGRKYDENGNLKDWWTTEDSIKFFEQTKKIIEQFNSYVVLDSLHINGKLTQGENIADLGGIMMAYEAFKKTDQYKKNEYIAGFSPTQRFFLGYAFRWMVNQRPEKIADQVRSDYHPPAKFRVIGPLSNMPEFYKAFNVKESDSMWRTIDQRIKIW